MQDHIVLGAGPGVYADEPNVPHSPCDLANTVVLAPVGLARSARGDGAVAVDHLRAWLDTGKALTPVAETPNPA